jgi:ferredoxin
LKRKKWTKSDFEKRIKSLDGYKVFAPVQADKVAIFAPVCEGDALAFDKPNTRTSVKSVLFPQTETLFCYERCGRNMAIKDVPLDNERKVVFGVRACDAASMKALDAVFSSKDYTDPYYMKRRENTTFVVSACNEPEPTCFCTSFGLGPWSREGADVFVCDLGDHRVAESLTEQGEALLTAMGGEDLAEAPAEAGKLKEAAEKAVKKVELGDLSAKLKRLFNDARWEALSERCLGCGICSYICPTCHCFDIQDEVGQECGKRVRNWDTCMLPLFSLHVSGHNPRTSGHQRIRQRVMHKFNYFVENFGQVACVGCGRCIQSCPANMDIREIIELLKA